jgi:hypothetical protein
VISRRSHVVRLIALAVLTGCYVYRPLGTVGPQVGTRVTAELTDYGSDALARSVGPGIVTLRGGVVSAESADITLSVTSVTDRSGQMKSWRGERLRVPRVAVQEYQERKFSPGRSVLLGVALLGSVLAAREAFEGGTRGGTLPRGGGGGVPQ